MLYLFGIAITFFLLLLLLAKKGKTNADFILACWLAFIGIHLLFYYLFIAGKIYDYPALLGLSFPLPLVHGPFLYLYAAELTGRISLKNKKHLLHFIPALLAYAYLFPFFLLPAEQKILVFKNKGAGYEAFQAIITIAIILSGIVYCTLTFMLHSRHKRNILNQFSYTEKINLDWIRYLMYGIALIWIFVIFGKDSIIFGVVVFFVLFMGFFGIRQVGIFTRPGISQSTQAISGPTQSETGIENFSINQQDEANEISDSIPELSIVDGTRLNSDSPKKKYSRSGLTNEAAEELHVKLKQLIAAEKIYEDSMLTLTSLAKKLGTHPNYLSQVINEKEGKNFYDFINTLRIEEFIKIVTSPDNQKFTLLSLAYECGFNSKSSFNKYFKKVTGLSPTAYLQEMNIKDVA